MVNPPTFLLVISSLSLSCAPILANRLETWGRVVDKGNRSVFFSSSLSTVDPTVTLTESRQIGTDNGFAISSHEHIYARAWASASLRTLKTYAEFELEQMEPGSYTTWENVALATAVSFEQFSLSGGGPAVHFLPEYHLQGTADQGSPLSGSLVYSCAVWGTSVKDAPFECRGTDGLAGGAGGAFFRFIDEMVKAQPHPLTLVPRGTPFLWYHALQTNACLLTEDTGLQIGGKYFVGAKADFSSSLTLSRVLLLDQDLRPVRGVRVEGANGLPVPIHPLNQVPEPGSLFLVPVSMLLLVGLRRSRVLDALRME